MQQEQYEDRTSGRCLRPFTNSLITFFVFYIVSFVLYIKKGKKSVSYTYIHTIILLPVLGSSYAELV